MKKSIIYISLTLISYLTAISCQDVVDVKLNTAPPKLVVDANLKYLNDSIKLPQTIILTTTTDYYNTQIPPATGAQVTVTNSKNQVFNFYENTNTPGHYICNDFLPEINETYTLKLIYKNEVYTASEKLTKTPEIEKIEQSLIKNFTKDFIEIKIFFKDDGLQDNYYVTQIINDSKILPKINVLNNQFFKGKEMYQIYLDDELKSGDNLNMSLQTTSQQYYNFLYKLISISGNTSGPFGTPPAVLRGNVINETKSENYPLGYFSIGQIQNEFYTVK